MSVTKQVGAFLAVSKAATDAIENYVAAREHAVEALERLAEEVERENSPFRWSMATTVAIDARDTAICIDENLTDPINYLRERADTLHRLCILAATTATDDGRRDTADAA